MHFMQICVFLWHNSCSRSIKKEFEATAWLSGMVLGIGVYLISWAENAKSFHSRKGDQEGNQCGLKNYYFFPQVFEFILAYAPEINQNIFFFLYIVLKKCLLIANLVSICWSLFLYLKTAILKSICPYKMFQLLWHTYLMQIYLPVNLSVSSNENHIKHFWTTSTTRLLWARWPSPLSFCIHVYQIWH